MVLFIAENNNIAIISSIASDSYIVSVFESFESFKASEAPLYEKKLLGLPNMLDLRKEFVDWVVEFRDDYTWNIIDNDPSIPLIPNVPQSVSARQIRLWLIQHGITLSLIDSAIDSIEDPSIRETIRIEWEYAPYIERNHPWLIPLAESLGLTSEQVDQAFIEASQI